MVGSSSSISGNASGGSSATATEELFRLWRSQCKKKTTALQREAASVFRSWSTTTTVAIDNNNTLLQTRPSHEQSLALLLKELGPAFADAQSRVGGLHCVWGAVAGCPSLPVPVIDLLSQFLLTHCGPLLPSNETNDETILQEEEYHDQSRDAALQALTAVVRCPLPECEDTDTSATAVDWSRSIASRLKLAESATTHRCSEPQTTSDIYGTPPPRARVASGLSTMPRSRRSLCFDILQAAVDRVDPWLMSLRSSKQKQQQGANDNNDEEQQQELKDAMLGFAEFSAACLHGESDPRCLQQLLRCLHSIQKSFLLLASEFPIDPMFDAVAPYYPIQFSPPPHNPHGITKTSLTQSLMRVLAWTEYDASVKQAHRNRDTMLSLSLGIVLERIIPPADDEPATMFDRSQGTQDLKHLLFPKATTTSLSSMSSLDASIAKIELLDTAAVRHLSDCLLALHEETSLAVVKGGPDADLAKETATLCRSLVSKIAKCCELSTKPRTQLWDTFVAQPLQRLSSQLVSRPSTDARLAVAYIACLSACGAPRTLQRCLHTGLQPLLDNLLKGRMPDDVATTVYGIGAMCSSCRVAVEAMGEVVLHPHPLQPYTDKVVDKLCGMVMAKVAPTRGRGGDHPAAVAAVRALEAVLTASPAHLYEAALVRKVSAFLEVIAAEVSGNPEEGEEDTADDASLREWRLVCSQTLGGVLGQALEDNDHKPVPSILHINPMANFLREDVLRKLVSSSVGSGQRTRVAFSTSPVIRYDRKALALACVGGPGASRTIIHSLLERICEAQTETEKLACVEAISYVLRLGGAAPARTIQVENGSSGYSLSRVLANLSSLGLPDSNEKNLESRFGKSMLELPPSEDDVDLKKSIVRSAYRMIPLLLPMYRDWVDPDHLKALSYEVGHCLPPLSPSDSIRASVYLPFFARALETATRSTVKAADIKDSVLQFLPFLCSFAMDAEFEPEARSFAGACLYPALVKVIPKSSSSSSNAECLVAKMVKEQVLPALYSLFDKMEYQASGGRSLSGMLSLLSVLTAAAAARGGPSTLTSNALVQMFIDLAVDHCSVDPLSSHSVGKIDFSPFAESGNGSVNDMAMEAASAFGALLSRDSGSSLYQQRFAYLAAKKLSGALEKDTQEIVGSLAMACHVVCSSDLKSVGKESLRNLSKLVIGKGLVYAGAFSNTRNLSALTMSKLQKLVLASTIKLISYTTTLSRDGYSDGGLLSPNNLHFLVTGVLRMYASTTEIAVKVLALQVLDAIPMVTGHLKPTNTGPVSATKGYVEELKPAVISILEAAMNDPIPILRHSSVQVRNSWCVL